MTFIISNLTDWLNSFVRQTDSKEEDLNSDLSSNEQTNFELSSTASLEIEAQIETLRIRPRWADLEDSEDDGVPPALFSPDLQKIMSQRQTFKKRKKEKKKKKKTKPTTTRFADAYNFRTQKTLTMLQTFKLSKLEKHYNVFMVVVQTKPEILKLQQYTFFSLVRRIAIHLKTRLQKKTKIVYQFLSNDTITWESLWETANFFKYVLPQGIAFAPRFQNSDALIIVTINAFYWSPLSTTAKRPIIFFDSSFRFTIV